VQLWITLQSQSSIDTRSGPVEVIQIGEVLLVAFAWIASDCSMTGDDQIHPLDHVRQ
jgi:hypothetical protein